MHILRFALGQPAFVFIALFGAVAAFRRSGHGPVEAGCLGLVALGASGFGALMASYAALPHVVVQDGLAILAGATTLLLFGLALRHRQWRDEMAVPAVLALVATWACLALTFGDHATADPLDQAQSRWMTLPDDNSLPYHLAEAFKAGAVPTGSHIPVMGDWQFSDRPPLQTALFLMTPGSFGPDVGTWAYEGAAAALQGLGLYSAWLLARAVGADRRASALAAVALAFTPLAIIHGAYVWPKLLAGAYTLVFAALTLTPAGRDMRLRVRGIAAGGAAALAMLAHGGSIFALLPIAGLAALMRVGLGLRTAGLVTASAALLYAPWLLYQKLVDPPGDRLIKWHLAGLRDVDPRPLGTAIADAYRAVGFDGALAARRGNLPFMLHGWVETLQETGQALHDALCGCGDLRADLLALRQDQFYFVLPSISLCGAALFAAPLIAWVCPDLRALCLTVWGTLAVWLLLIFEPGGTVVHQGSYFPEMALVVVAVVAAARVRFGVAVALVGAQAVLVTFQYAA